jgi:hypothetical protein
MTYYYYYYYYYYYFHHRHHHLDALFLINVFENKTECCSITESASLRVPTKQIGDFSNFNVRNASRPSASTRRVTAANICKSLDVFNKRNISLEDTFSIA